MSSGHILDLYCVRLSNAAPFCENYTKFYFDAKHLEKGLNTGCRGLGGGGGAKFLVLFFHKKVSFLANIKCCPKFLVYAVNILLHFKIFFSGLNKLCTW